MPTIYRKTEKGRAEIGSRAHHLPPRLRGLLIMADGHRTDQQLAELGPHVATGLSKLAEEGFLEALIERARGAAPQQPHQPAILLAGSALSPARAAAAQVEADLSTQPQHIR